MKKLFVWSLVVVLSFVLTGCGCEHEYDEGKITKEATCKKEGVKTFTCQLCGEEKTEAVPLAEHTYDSGKVTKEASCTEEGERTLTCKVCGNEKVEAIKMKDHDYEEKITKEATFTEEGIKTFTCKTCGDSYTKSVPVRDDPIIFTVEDKINYERDTSAWRFFPFVELVCKVENMTDRDIKGVEGTLNINDLFGKQIISINWDIMGEDIPAKGSITQKDYGIEINEFVDNEMKLYNTDYDDLKFEYIVKQIIYVDDIEQNSEEQDTKDNSDNDDIAENQSNTKVESVSMTTEEAMQWLNGSWDAGDGITYNFELNADGTLPIPSVGQFWSGYSSGTWSCNGNKIVMTGFREETPNMGFGYMNAKYKVTKIDENTASIEGISYIEGHEEIGSNSTTKTMKRI